ncbi:hypothetical protein BP5796_04446 [Coleophoma crateriformis]|uniref:Glucose-methanol-choline oxidoreductase N-terminal domain-containing protein n=1 Tax=Coleophoma crateriformis TaxID=565419 RepID=A0A3D8S9C1_9HELO|nr:hypothetical protein BP5796_04446 [Coleophoma crateriformis]
MAAPALPALVSLEAFLKNEYDFVVIGGGTAGLAMAARLSENPAVKVGVLEAGPALIGDPMIMIPAMYVKSVGDAKYDWLHKTVPQPSAGGKSLDWPRGKCLGGSSAINFLMYVRGQASDYDDWARLGNEGWAFKDLLPYFKKHENFQDPKDLQKQPNMALETRYDASVHGKLGPISTSFGEYRIPPERDWVAACATLGENMGSPLNAWSGDHLGNYHSLSTIDRRPGEMNGTRSYSTTGYLLPNAQRPNLFVLTEALVTRIILSSDKVATGVEFLHSDSDEKHSVSVKKEVILSAGAIKSPQVLELSGIGSPEVLSKAGVKCLVENRRVGEHLQDHSAVAFGYELIPGETTLDAVQDPATMQAAFGEYMAEKTGPFASAGSTMGFASFAGLSTPEEIKSIQDSILGSGDLDIQSKAIIAEGLGSLKDGSIQFVLLPASLDVEKTYSQTAFLQPPTSQLGGKQGLVLAACVARPASVGSCHITSAEPKADPAIDPAYLTHQSDVEVLIKGYRLISKMVSTSPLKEKIAKRYGPDESLDLSTHEAAEKWIRNHVATEYHPIGTVGMGKEGVGAVDSNLKVYGVKGIRVVDASVFPLHISGNPLATVYATAEKAADLVKAEWAL